MDQEQIDNEAIAEFRAEFPAFALTEKEKSMSDKHECKVDGCKFRTPEPCCPPAPGSEPGGPSEEEWNGKLPCVPPAPGSEPGGPSEEEWSGRLLIPAATTSAENCRHEDVVDGKCADCGCWITLANQPAPPAKCECPNPMDPERSMTDA